MPFLGDSPEELFANIINEEVEYPEGDEALEPEAESLIRLLLEKNPVDRLGTLGGAAQVSAAQWGKYAWPKVRLGKGMVGQK